MSDDRYSGTYSPGSKRRSDNAAAASAAGRHATSSRSLLGDPRTLGVSSTSTPSSAHLPHSITTTTASSHGADDSRPYNTDKSNTNVGGSGVSRQHKREAEENESGESEFSRPRAHEIMNRGRTSDSSAVVSHGDASRKGTGLGASGIGYNLKKYTTREDDVGLGRRETTVSAANVPHLTVPPSSMSSEGQVTLMHIFCSSLIFLFLIIHWGNSQLYM